jgi:CBS domain-containing protein
MSTAVISLKETDTSSRVQQEMVSAAIRHLPVVDGHNHVIGIVSNHDVLRALGKSEGRPVPIGQIMIRKVLTVGVDTPAHAAAALMLEHKIGSLPVVSDDLQLIGIITETDFLHIAQQALQGSDISRGDWLEPVARCNGSPL